MTTETERAIFKGVEQLYHKKADELVYGTVPDAMYRAHSHYLKAIRDVMKIMSDAAKAVSESKAK